MFCVTSEKLSRTSFACPQARPKDLAHQIPSGELHFRSLANALRHVRHSMSYVSDALQRWDDDEWPRVEDAVARELSSATMFLSGILDGMVILEARLSGQEPTTSMSFERTSFNSAELRKIQEETKALKSTLLDGQPLYADFWTLSNFWKHYFPYQPRPSAFTRSAVARDFSVPLSSGCGSGPILHDLLVPTFNNACYIMSMIAELVHEPFDLQKFLL